MVPQDVPQLQLAAAAAEALPELEKARAFNNGLGECPWYLRASRTSSSVASAGVRKPSSGRALQGSRVGVLAGLHKIVQVEVALTNEVALRSG